MTGKTIRSKSGFGFTIHDDRDGAVTLMLSTGSSVSVSGFDPAELRAALDEVTPGHSRRHDSPDYADGGMAAAAIEKEAERRPSNLLAAYWLREYDRRDEDAKRWKEATRRAVQGQVGLRHELSLAGMRAEKHRRAEVDHRNNARCWMKTSEECQATAEEWEARAERAEQERDEAKWWAERWKEAAEEGETLIEHLRAEQPRALTPDAITDSHVLSARLKANALGWFGRFDAPTEEWRQVLTAALTEPPSRPEGAEDVESQIEAWDQEYGDDAIMTAPRLRELADFLAERGVRVTGAES